MRGLYRRIEPLTRPSGTLFHKGRGKRDLSEGKPTPPSLGPASRSFHPRAKRIGVGFRHGFQQRLDGLATDDFAVPREHPVRDVGLLDASLLGMEGHAFFLPRIPRVGH